MRFPPGNRISFLTSPVCFALAHFVCTGAWICIENKKNCVVTVSEASQFFMFLRPDGCYFFLSVPTLARALRLSIISAVMLSAGLK